MSSQPVSGDQYALVAGGVGTTVVSASPAVLRRVVIPGTYVGSVTISDSATAAGTAAANRLAVFGLPGAQQPSSVEFNIQCRTGIVYEATGTPTMTLVWEH